MSNILPSAVKSPEHLLSAPLDELLVEADAEIVESAIEDQDFYGALHQLRGGHAVLSMPQGRPEVERQVIVRSLLARLMDVVLPPLPRVLEMVAVSEVTA
jgi:hypothetical protein